MKLIDTHCHLCSAQLEHNVDALLESAQSAGVEKIINVAYDLESTEKVTQQIAKYPMLFGAAGIQPHDATSYTPELAERLRQVVRNNKKMVAVGEIGIDGFHKLSPIPQQIECYEHFLRIAAQEELPAIIHMRETFDDVWNGIRKNPGVRGVIHCFTGTLGQARSFLDAGLYISFSGIVTFKNSDALRDVARYIPKDRLLVETDSPYLAPPPHRGKPNQPAWVTLVCEHLAQCLQMNTADLAEQTTANAMRLFTRLT